MQALQCPRKNQLSDDNTFWCRACFNFSLQFALRLGLHDEIPAEKIPAEVDAFKDEVLVQNDLKVNIMQIAHWDEKHFKQRAGCQTESLTQYKKDANGIYSKDGTFDDSKKPVSNNV